MTGKAREENSSETEAPGPCQSETQALTRGRIHIRKIPQLSKLQARALGSPRAHLENAWALRLSPVLQQLGLHQKLS